MSGEGIFQAPFVDGFDTVEGKAMDLDGAFLTRRRGNRDGDQRKKSKPHTHG